MPITARTVANVRAARHARINLAFTPGVCSSRVSAGSAASYQVRRFQLQCTSTQVEQLEPSVAEPTAAGSNGQLPAAAAQSETLPVTALDIRVGQIRAVEQHPDADSLFVEQVDVGEGELRTIVSGLVQFVPLEEMRDRKVVVLCNLKPRNMRGVKSNGMLLCASNAAHDRVEPLDPPSEAAIGQRVWFGNEVLQPAPAEPNRVQKKKLWEAVQPDLKTSEDRVANYKGFPMTTAAGPISCKTLTSASIS